MPDSTVVPKGQTHDGAGLQAARRAVRHIAQRQRAQAPEIARRIFASLTAEVPEYAAITDDRLAEDVRSVSAAGVLLWLDLLRSGRIPAGDQLNQVREG